MRICQETLQIFIYEGFPRMHCLSWLTWVMVGIILEILYTVVIFIGGSDRIFIARAQLINYRLLNMANRLLMSQNLADSLAFRPMGMLLTHSDAFLRENITTAGYQNNFFIIASNSCFSKTAFWMYCYGEHFVVYVKHLIFKNCWK